MKLASCNHFFFGLLFKLLSIQLSASRVKILVVFYDEGLDLSLPEELFQLV